MLRIVLRLNLELYCEKDNSVRNEGERDLSCKKQRAGLDKILTEMFGKSCIFSQYHVS